MQAKRASINKSTSSNKSRTKNNFEVKQILKMNVHHHKMNSQRPTNTMQGSGSNFIQAGHPANAAGGPVKTQSNAAMKKIMQQT